MDLIALLVTIGLHFDLITGWRFPMGSVIYLIIKGIIFRGEFLSIIDLLIGIYLFLMIVFGVHWFLTYIVIAYFAYKLLLIIFMH
jgi:hypothetical protein